MTCGAESRIFRVNAYVYVISCPLGLVKVGVAGQPERRLRNLQIGSPVPLELAGQYPMSDLATAQAVAAALKERFRERRERGDWFRATALEVRQAIGDRRIVDLYRRAEAGERAGARCCHGRGAAAPAPRAPARGCGNVGRGDDPGGDRRGARPQRPHASQLGEAEKLP